MTLWRAGFCTDLDFGIIEVSEDSDGALVQPIAFFSQSGAPRAAVDQPDT